MFACKGFISEGLTNVKLVICEEYYYSIDICTFDWRFVLSWL